MSPEGNRQGHCLAQVLVRALRLWDFIALHRDDRSDKVLSTLPFTRSFVDYTTVLCLTTRSGILPGIKLDFCFSNGLSYVKKKMKIFLGLLEFPSFSIRTSDLCIYLFVCLFAWFSVNIFDWKIIFLEMS